MTERSLRGMSIGAKSLESDENVDFAARKEISYVCPEGHRTIIPFAEDIEAPQSWQCRCGMIATLEDNSVSSDPIEPGKPQRTHWDMLIERRDEKELKELLEKRIQMHNDGWFPDYE
ncbi:MAG: RNA polymerase-binding protein RbpA [Aeriscardovia sp.]|nr:RNA polymerase-binding protein RbpA [Aeriscardovia sp.]